LARRERVGIYFIREKERLMPLSDSSEVDLIRRAKAGGDPKHCAAYAEAFDKHRKGIYSFLCRMLEGDLEEAKDQLQDVFVAGWKNLAQLNNETCFRSWLFTIAANKAHGHLRQKQRVRMLDIDNDGAGDYFQAMQDVGFEEGVVKKVLTEQALARVPFNYRACLVLKEWGYSIKEIAEILGLSEKSIPGMLLRGREMFCNAYRSLEENARLDLEGRPD